MSFRPRVLLIAIAMLLVNIAAFGKTPTSPKPDAAGNVPAKPGVTKALTATGYPACVMFFNGGLQWKIDLTIDPNTYPFQITGGTIQGSICGSNWTVTGGSIGSVLNVNAKLTPPVSGCATTFSLTGNVNQPPSYKGHYGFPSQAFPFTGLFTGYHTCP
jgi:hypothetical protein